MIFRSTHLVFRAIENYRPTTVTLFQQIMNICVSIPSCLHLKYKGFICSKQDFLYSSCDPRFAVDFFVEKKWYSRKMLWILTRCAQRENLLFAVKIFVAWPKIGIKCKYASEAYSPTPNTTNNWNKVKKWNFFVQHFFRDILHCSVITFLFYLFLFDCLPSMPKSTLLQRDSIFLRAYYSEGLKRKDPNFPAFVRSKEFRRNLRWYLIG